MINKKLLFPIALAIDLLIIDQVTKIWVKTNMTIGQEIVIFDWFKILFVENEGMAFSLTLGGTYGKVILTLFRIVAVLFLGYLLRRFARQAETTMSFMLSLSLIIAGALGNIIDSVCYGVLFSHSTGQIATFLPTEGGYAPLLHGKVVDMFYFPLFSTSLPNWIPIFGGQHVSFFNAIFNCADAYITVGVALLLLFQRNHFSATATTLPTNQPYEKE